jgi:acyl carrier protein
LLKELKVMESQELRAAVAEILEAEPSELNEMSELEHFKAYDSVARLSLMVALSDFAGRPVTVPELMELHTYGDVMNLVRSCSNNGQKH